MSSSNGVDLLEEWGDPQPSEIAGILRERKLAGLPVFDMVTANPQEHGFEFPPADLERVVSQAVTGSRFYRPDARGQMPAREAVAWYHGNGVSSSSVILTPGTSFAYWACFRLLCRPGEEILCPWPTYPLFDDIARLAGVRVRRFHLAEHAGRWGIDAEELAFQVTSATRAIVLVSPHNPTGSVASADELGNVCRVARKHGLSVIFDEVFREFLHAQCRVCRPAEFDAPLAVTLNGLSKMLSLPGMKAGWLVAEGDQARCDQFLNSAEYLLDTFLPVSELTQAALPALLEHHPALTTRFAALYRERMQALVGECAGQGLGVGKPEGGVYLVLRVASDRPSTQLAGELLREHGVLVHPGPLYGLEDDRLVLTCVPRPPWPIRSIAEIVGRDKGIASISPAS